MIRPFSVTCVAAVFVLLAVCVEAQGRKLKVPVMPGMKTAKRMTLSEALDKSTLCDFARMGPDLAASMAEGDKKATVYVFLPQVLKKH